MDSVGIVEGGGNDRDRVATTTALGHPGIHVHQPQNLPGFSGVASDGVSRRPGQNLPNSIGAWFNGDITNGNPASAPIRYLEDSLGFISVVSPDGAVLTPGAAEFPAKRFLPVQRSGQTGCRGRWQRDGPHRADGRYCE